jgi:hypothetical protein
MASKNDITGDTIVSREPSNKYRDGWDKIFGKKDPNIIPPVTDPMGQYWEQPDSKDIVIDDKNAIMNQETFRQLKTYSTSLPSGVYPGKMWKAEITFEDSSNNYWVLRWFGETEDPKKCSNNFRFIVIK